ncbi:Peroxiredoxin HYR1 [Smittium culicis]|uniref:Glutathione peroxidase n=1 Tax=Smittium culicis TaxID=133412 RepID=A0A1R1X490_9FUNG|nr:Peroxiredoxin HYR1 [Smittium culicis]OMJ22363.1 Peroxiredoxin HYR1 [Smittium culicis]OMJ23403.1 Peroxiredoxin HYR1 [Smittium culicis]
MTSKFYSFVAKDAKNNDFPFSQLANKVVLIVNVASKCGFTPQYKGLEELNQKYKDQGLAILGFPCNQFGSQEPGTQEEIASFCSMNYGVTFPVLKKIEVNGDNEDPIYKYLKETKPGILGLKRIKWNFEKFLIDSEGNVSDRFASTSSPSSIEKKIVELLAKIKPDGENKL